MDQYVLVIILTAIGFFALAAILLVPVWRFLVREERVSQEWTVESLSRRVQEESLAEQVLRENGLPTTVTDDSESDAP